MVPEQLKRLERKRKRQYRLNKRSKKYKKLQKAFKIKVLEAKRKLKKNMVDDVMVRRTMVQQSQEDCKL